MWTLKVDVRIFEIFATGRQISVYAINKVEGERIIRFLSRPGHSYIYEICDPTIYSEIAVPNSPIDIELYNVTGKSYYRICRCFFPDEAELLFTRYTQEFPNHMYQWVDNRVEVNASQRIYYQALPSAGTSKAERSLYNSICSRLDTRMKFNALKTYEEMRIEFWNHMTVPGISKDIYDEIFSIAWTRMEDYKKLVLTAKKKEIIDENISINTGVIELQDGETHTGDSRKVSPSVRQDSISKGTSAIAAKKYYAVARGAITGIFNDVAMFESATRGFPHALARSFKTKEGAEKWLISYRRDFPITANMRIEKREERWARKNAELIASYRVVEPSLHIPTKEIKHIGDLNRFLAEQLDSLFKIDKDISSEPIEKRPPNIGLRKETQDFLAFGFSIGRDYLEACDYFLKNSLDAFQEKTPKQIAAMWMKEVSIPSCYKLLINDLVTYCCKNAAASDMEIATAATEDSYFSHDTHKEDTHADSYIENVPVQPVIPACKVEKLYYAAMIGKRTMVFTDENIYTTFLRQYPDAPLRSFDTKKEAETWLQEISANPEILKKASTNKKSKAKKYYAVAQGRFVGIFDNVDMYLKAIKGFSNPLARSFKNKDAAKSWLESAYEQIDIPISDSDLLPVNASGSQIQQISKAEIEVVTKDINDAPNLEKQEKTVKPMESSTDTEDSQPSTSVNPVSYDRNSIIYGIQFDKHIFRGMPNEAQKRFRKTFAQRLEKLGNIFQGHNGAGNDFKLVAPKNRRVFKRRIGKNRLSMVYKDGILTLLKFSSHDRQMVDIRNLSGKSIGYVYYDVEDFLRQMKAWTTAKKDERLTFGEYMASPQHFVFDSDQMGIIVDNEKTDNLSVIGSAGTGKSIVGLKRLGDRLKETGHDALYLTMSENLVYTLGFEFNKEAEAANYSSHADIQTTFDFLRRCFKKRYPKIPENSLLNATQSFTVFRRFWADEMDWTQFWNQKDSRSAMQSEGATLLIAWREIHGILKGAVPIEIDYKHLNRLPEVLPESTYRERMRQEKKDSVRSVLWTDTLYSTYRKYQAYLQRHKLFDDNDIARMLLQKPPEKSHKYATAFIDECQDLTQMELLAIFHLLAGVKEKRMTSDRCQMVQPTYFDEGWMRTTANVYDNYMGKKLSDTSWKPRYLRYNYRSTRHIIEFQNYVVQYFRYNDILTLKQMEMEEIHVPPLTTAGIRPIWISSNEQNKHALIHDLWKKLDASELQTIFAFQESLGKKDFPLAEDDAVTDIISCKGMEYPSVLLYNILSETQFDATMAWKYFYVGATRSNACLLIYEDSAKPGTQIYEFLEEAVELGLVDHSDDLLAQAEYGNETWLGYIYQCIHENTDDNRMETAENALNFGQYELALSIYSHEGRDKDMIAYCRGKVMESRQDFRQAVENYASLEAGWSNRGRNRRNSVEGLLNQPDIDGVSFLGAYLLSEKGSKNLIPEAKFAWDYKYGDTTEFYSALHEALTVFPFALTYFSQWTGNMIGIMGEEVNKIRKATTGF